MALMKFREPNQVKWQGCRPGHNGTFESHQSFQNAVGNKTIYTVAVGKHLFITHSWLTAEATATLGQAYMFLEIGGVGHYIHQLRFSAAPNTEFTVDTSHYFPIEVPTGDLIRLYVSAVGIVAMGGFNGYLIDV